MKVICKKQFPSLAGLLDKGDIVEIISIYSDRERIFSYKKVKTERGYINVPDVVSPAGDYTGYKFKSKNGNVYTDTEIKNHIGYVPLGEIFDPAD